jgi:pimeloyl-ACP methyl ester carboxylesterase
LATLATAEDGLRLGQQIVCSRLPVSRHGQAIGPGKRSFSRAAPSGSPNDIHDPRATTPLRDYDPDRPQGASTSKPASAVTHGDRRRWARGARRRRRGIEMRVDSNGVGIEYEVTGEGRPVVLLHGFPDSGRLWRHQVPALAEAGFQVIVPDMRGYGASDKPAEVEAYGMQALAGDVLAVMADAGVARAHVVGHDWGAGVAWALGAVMGDHVDHLVAMSVGHPATFLANGFEQYEKSWYMLLFQFAGIAEQWLSNEDWANFRAWSDHPDMDAAIAELETNGSLTPGLNYYRANVRPESFVSAGLEIPPVQAPTMGVWSTGDIALTETQMTNSAANVSGLWRYERLDGPGHWMQLETPDEVNRLLLDFLPA